MGCLISLIMIVPFLTIVCLLLVVERKLRNYHNAWLDSLTPEQKTQYVNEIFNTPIPKVRKRRRRRRSTFFKSSPEDVGYYRTRWGGLGGMMK